MVTSARNAYSAFFEMRIRPSRSSPADRSADGLAFAGKFDGRPIAFVNARARFSFPIGTTGCTEHQTKQEKPANEWVHAPDASGGSFAGNANIVRMCAPDEKAMSVERDLA